MGHYLKSVAHLTNKGQHSQRSQDHHTSNYIELVDATLVDLFIFSLVGLWNLDF